MSRIYSLAYLTSHRCTPPQSIGLAAELGYGFVGLRLWPNAAGAPQQQLLGRPDILRETSAAIKDTGVEVFDLEIIRIGSQFDPHAWDALYEAGAALGAKAVLVAGDDMDLHRLSDHYGRLCEVIAPYGMTADLEFMPWTAVPDARTALRVVDLAGVPSNAGILVDAIHFGRSRTSLEDIQAIPRRLLHYAQIGDAVAGTHWTVEQMIHTARCERLLPGEGSVDLGGLFAALPQDLPISVEIIHLERERTLSAREWADQCLKASRPWCESTPGASK